MRSYRPNGNHCDTPDPERRTIEDVEADIRILMSLHAKIAARGFDTSRDRHTLHRRIDTLLDEHAFMVDIAEIVA